MVAKVAFLGNPRKWKWQWNDSRDYRPKDEARVGAVEVKIRKEIYISSIPWRSTIYMLYWRRFWLLLYAAIRGLGAVFPKFSFTFFLHVQILPHLAMEAICNIILENIYRISVYNKSKVEEYIHSV